MFKNLDSDNDTKVGHTRSGREFKEVHLGNIFKQNYGDEGFYSGEEEDLTDEEHSEPAREEKGKYEEPRRDEPKTSRATQIAEVSTINPPIVSVALRNQNSQSHQSPQSTITSSSTYAQIRNLGNLGRSMADEMRIPIFRGDGSEYPDQHWFLCEDVWNIKNVTDEAVKRNQFSTALRNSALSWYMKLAQGLAQPKPLNQIKNALIAEIKKTKSESQCIIDLKDIKQKVAKPVWEFDQRFKTLTGRLTF
jgi:hypothetical protein